jgi:hypothetical protein
MGRYAMTSFRFFMIALAAVCVVEANPFIPTALLASDCPDVIAAKLEGQVAADGPWIAKQCPEACGGPLMTGTFVRRWESDKPSRLDRRVVRRGPGRVDPRDQCRTRRAAHLLELPGWMRG